MHRIIPPNNDPAVVALRRMTVVGDDDQRRPPVPAPFIVVNGDGKRVDSFLTVTAAKRALRVFNGA